MSGIKKMENMKTLVLQFGVILAVFVLCLNGNKFRSDYIYIKEIDGFIKYHEIPANWREARLRCHLEGSKLASPLNIELRQTMLKLSESSARPTFTGIHAIFSRGDYFSVEGVPLGKIPHTWRIGEPDNNHDKEGCIIMLADGTFADVDCAEPFPYLCYKTITQDMIMNECGTSDSAYTLDKSTGSCYKFHQFPRTWSRAYMTCAAEGAYLAVINSDAEGMSLGALYRKWGVPLPYAGMFYWETAHIGFSDWTEHGGEWITTHGDNLKDAGYDKFSPGQPDNASIEFCGGITKAGLLDDMWCEQRAQFICEKDPAYLAPDYENN